MVSFVYCDPPKLGLASCKGLAVSPVALQQKFCCVTTAYPVSSDLRRNEISHSLRSETSLFAPLSCFKQDGWFPAVQFAQLLTNCIFSLDIFYRGRKAGLSSPLIKIMGRYLLLCFQRFSKSEGIYKILEQVSQKTKSSYFDISLISCCVNLIWHFPQLLSDKSTADNASLRFEVMRS